MNIFKYLYNQSQCKENRIESSSSCTQYVFRYRASPKLRHQQKFFISYSVCLNSFSVPKIFSLFVHIFCERICMYFRSHDSTFTEFRWKSLLLWHLISILHFMSIYLYPEIIHKHFPCRLTAIVSQLIRPRGILCLFFGSGCSNQQNT